MRRRWFRKKVRDLEAEQARFTRLKPEEYPAPVNRFSDPGSILESSFGFSAVLPPLIREATVNVDGPCADSALLTVEGTGESGPFCHLAGIAGVDYYVYVLSVR